MTYSGADDRRKSERIKRNFILTYRLADNPDAAFSASQLKNISYGGMCFVTEAAYAPGTELEIALKTPFFSGKTYFKGRVLESHEKVAGIIYQTRVELKNISNEGCEILRRVIEFFSKEEK